VDDKDDYDYNKELDKEIDIDGPGSVPQQPSIPQHTDGDDRIFTTDEIDVDGADEDEVVDSDVGGPRIGGNDGDITERGRQWFLFSPFYFITFHYTIWFIFVYLVLCFVIPSPSLFNSLSYFYCTSFFCPFGPCTAL